MHATPVIGSMSGTSAYKSQRTSEADRVESLKESRMGKKPREMRLSVSMEVEFSVAPEEVQLVADRIVAATGLSVQIKDGCIVHAAFKTEGAVQGAEEETEAGRETAPSKALQPKAKCHSVSVQTKRDGWVSKRGRSKRRPHEREQKRTRLVSAPGGCSMLGQHEGGEYEEENGTMELPIDLTMRPDEYPTNPNQQHGIGEGDSENMLLKQEEGEVAGLDSARQAPVGVSAMDLDKREPGAADVQGKECDRKKKHGAMGASRDAPHIASQQKNCEGQTAKALNNGENQAMGQEDTQLRARETGEPNSAGNIGATGKKVVGDIEMGEPQQGGSPAAKKLQPLQQQGNVSTQKSDKTEATQEKLATPIEEIICRNPILVAKTSATRAFFPGSKGPVGLQWLCYAQIGGRQKHVLSGSRCPDLNVIQTKWFEPLPEGDRLSEKGREPGADFMSMWQGDLHQSWDGAVVVLVPNTKKDCQEVKSLASRMIREGWVSISDVLSVGAAQGRIVIVPFRFLTKMSAPMTAYARINATLESIMFDFEVDIAAGQIMCGLFCRKPLNR